MFRKVCLICLLALMCAQPFSGRAAPMGTPAGATITVNSFADALLADGNCTLREALLAANSDTAVDACPAGSGEDTVVLPAGTFTFALPGMNEDGGLSGDLDIFSSLTLRGAGQELTRIDANMLDRVIDVLPGNFQVSIEALSLAHGGFGLQPSQQVYTGAGVRNQGSLSMLDVTVYGGDWGNLNADYGMGIANLGTLWLERVTITGVIVHKGMGGGLYNAGALVMTDSFIKDNYIDFGSGPGLYNTGFTNINNSEFVNNTQNYNSNFPGGNIYNSGEFNCSTCVMIFGSGYPGAVIYNSGIVKLQGGMIMGGDTYYTYGEAIFSENSLSLAGTTVIDGSSRAISGRGTLELRYVGIANRLPRVFAQQPNDGGGAINFHGTVVIANTRFENNIAWAHGGAVMGSGDWVIQDTTFARSQALSQSDVAVSQSGLGGAIYWRGGTLSITNSTISANTAAKGGGAIYIQDGEVLLESVTITENTTLENTGGSGLSLANGSVSLHNTILAGGLQPAAPDCYQFALDPVSGAPAASTVTSLGYNLFGAAAPCSISLTVGDQAGSLNAPLDPMLDILTYYGGFTITHALIPGSPALDRGPLTDCPPTDQRGVARPLGPACDIGAFELYQEGSWQVIDIDIRPLLAANPINLRSRGSVPVAVLSTPDFFAPAVVDPASLTFGRTGAEDSLAWLDATRPDCHRRDANRDRLLDLVCRFTVAKTDFQPGDTFGRLRGRTFAGAGLTGQDRVLILHPTSQAEDDQATLYDQRAFLGDTLLWLPLVR